MFGHVEERDHGAGGFDRDTVHIVEPMCRAHALKQRQPIAAGSSPSGQVPLADASDPPLGVLVFISSPSWPRCSASFPELAR